MKKISKSLFLAAASAFLLASCQIELVDPNEAKEPLQDDNTVILTLNAGFEGDEPETKTSLDGSTPAWTLGDKVTVVYTNNSDAAVTAESSGLASTASPVSFTVGLTDPKTSVDGYAYYPANDKSATSSTATLVIDNEQNPSTGTTFDGASDILVSKGFKPTSGTVNTQFRRLGAILRIQVSNAALSSEKILNLSVEGANPLAGDVAVRLSDGVATGITSGSNKVTADYGSGVFTAGAADKYVYLIVYPQTLASGSTLTVSGETENYTFSRSISLPKDIVLKAGHIQPLSISIPSVTLKDKVFLEERFSAAAGTFGWSGSVASSTFVSDVSGWVCDYKYAGTGCARFGKSGNAGIVTTPSITIPTPYQSQTIKLSFKTGAWTGCDDELGLSVDEGSITSSVVIGVGEWSEHTLDITGISKSPIKITFTPDERFYLDDVCVYYGTKPVEKASPELAFSSSSASAYLGETASFTEPTLTNTHSLDITYASDDEDVAMVASDGQVTLVGAGTATISASFAGNATYKSQTVSYLLTISTPTLTIAPSGDITMGGTTGNKATITITATHPWTATLNAAATTARGTSYKIIDSSDNLISGTVTGTAGVTTIKFEALGDGDPSETSSYGTITFTDNLHAATNSGSINIKQAAKAGFSTTYTSNVTMSAGSNSSDATVVISATNYDAIKCGSSSAAGVATVTVPSGTTKLHVHIAGWNKDTGKTIDITPKGKISKVNGVTATSLTATTDSGVSGSGSSFTLAGTSNLSTSYYFEIELTGIDSNTTITFTAHNASKNRFVLWGCNAE